MSQGWIPIDPNQDAQWGAITPSQDAQWGAITPNQDAQWGALAQLIALKSPTTTKVFITQDGKVLVRGVR
jgi:hypothetical protein